MPLRVGVSAKTGRLDLVGSNKATTNPSAFQRSWLLRLPRERDVSRPGTRGSWHLVGSQCRYLMNARYRQLGVH